MADEPTQTPVDDPPDPAAGEIRNPADIAKMAAARDRFKTEAASLRAERESLSTELEELRQFKQAQLEKQELDAGEYEKAKQRLLEQKADAEAKAHAAEERMARKAVDTAFASAPELFGPDGLTILPPDFASARFAHHVKYVPGENGDPEGLQVLGLDGEVIPGKDGRPASFVDAMRTLIDQWPEKERILRAGHASGSGSPGGGGAAMTQSRAELAARINRGESVDLKTIRTNPPPGTVQEGRFWDRQAKG